MRVTIDIETNDINDWHNLTDLKTLLCICVQVDDQEPKAVSADQAFDLMKQADIIVGHNILGFDIPALMHLFPKFVVDFSKVRDTMVTARLLHADQREKDFGLPGMPKELVGSHSLKAWGYRLGIQNHNISR